MIPLETIRSMLEAAAYAAHADAAEGMAPEAMADAMMDGAEAALRPAAEVCRLLGSEPEGETWAAVREAHLAADVPFEAALPWVAAEHLLLAGEAMADAAEACSVGDVPDLIAVAETGRDAFGAAAAILAVASGSRRAAALTEDGYEITDTDWE